MAHGSDQRIAHSLTSVYKVRQERHPLIVKQAQKLLRYVQGRSLEGLITVALATGMRQGELLGLRW